GAENVADLSLGNPVVEPPAAVVERLRELAASPDAGTHRYMPNAGYPSTRAAVAAHLARRTGVGYRGDDVVMTVGAGGGLNVIFKGLLDPEDEVIVLAPFFVEYRFYITNHGGRMVLVQTDERFRPDAKAIDAAITPRTRAVLVNAPNNPTGVVYPAEDLDALAEVLTRRSEEHGRPIYLISDEPYRAITYDDVDVPWPVRHYADTIHVTSFSKDLA
ncbi:MAG: aminotransferase class I/II-fold pyridoxal phosphate-dependent enzyme, partial [Planctomycetes bacterium]|nr:aminotransferase class I/II-fold pyridoxal phosphate-dependent enzyme [Planctomycetota bacterium]